jgi:glycosyltransferase involved in cell wall biosynthesis
MRSVHRTPPSGGAFSRRFTSYSGLFFDEFDPGSAWLREQGRISLPPLGGVSRLLIKGEFRAHPDARGSERGCPGLRILVNGQLAGEITPANPGAWELPVPVPPADATTIVFELTRVGLTNTLAFLGRVTGLGPWQRFRAQNRNRQLRLTGIATESGETIFDFSIRHSPYSPAYARRHARLGLNIAGFLTADLGIGESARCMVRAADAAGIATALVPLKLNCKNRLGDQTYAARLRNDNPHDVNVVHVDPPASRDLDHHHGPGFRAGKYNIGYFAWELPEYPDGWVSAFDYFDEIWCPSDFTTAAIAMKSPLPVLTMPHAIDFVRPTTPLAQLRARFGLPTEKFLFLTLFDLNSYAARKNPAAVVEAFRRAALPSGQSALVIKVQNVAGNEREFTALQAKLRDLPGTVLLTETLPRADVYALEAACDCFVSLHRSEGFGLAIAESMLLEKPVISTDWSAPAEFVDDNNGCPVRANITQLTENHGPYAKGSTWAEPDVDHAAEWMRRLFADRTLGPRLGVAARETIQQRFSPAVIGARYRQRLENIATF